MNSRQQLKIFEGQNSLLLLRAFSTKSVATRGLTLIFLLIIILFYFFFWGGGVGVAQTHPISELVRKSADTCWVPFFSL